MGIRFKQRVINFWLDQDYSMNALLGGSPRESLSGSIGRAATDHKFWAVHIAMPFVNWLMGSKTHCYDAMAKEQLRRDKNGTNN